MQTPRRQADETILAIGTHRGMVVEPGDAGVDVAAHDCRKQRLLAGKAGINGRLAGAGQACDFIHAGASKPALKKYAARGIQDTGVYLSGAFARRPPRSTRVARFAAFFDHRLLHPSRSSYHAIYAFCRRGKIFASGTGDVIDGGDK